jgi:thiol-disulfide isomerase/thioredoxin
LRRFLAPVLASLLVLAAGSAAAAEPPRPAWAGLAVAKAGTDPRPLGNILPDGPAILHFWATWCLPCRAELPALDRFAADLARDGAARRLVVLSVDSIPFERVEAFLASELGLSAVKTWQFVGGDPGSAFRILGYPTTLLVDADRRIARRFPGPVDWDDPGIRAVLMRHLENPK